MMGFSVENFIDVYLNVLEGLEKNFQKYATGTADYLGQAYDYNSIMHYPPYAFAKDTSKTTIDLVTSISPPPKIGQRKGLSEVDIKQIKKLFQCDDTKTTVPPSTSTAAPVTVAAPVTTAPTGTSPGTTSAPGPTTKATLATLTPVTNVGK